MSDPQSDSPQFDGVGGAAAELDAWFQRHVPNTALARDTALYNRIFDGVAQIKAALAFHISEE